MSLQKRKFQVFVSSTFEDMKDERQAAVAAILNAGHIPAGMELFSAGSESQLETIYKWISDSDVYVLLLGGRYGSIENNSGLSYTELEYRFAIENSIPHFTVAISEPALEDKIRLLGSNVIEKKNPTKMVDFRSLALSKSCRFYADSKDIQIAIMQRLNELTQDSKIKGWVRREDDLLSPDIEKIQTLVDKNSKLKSLAEGMDFEISLPTLPKLDDLTAVSISCRNYGLTQVVSIQASWAAFFPIFVSSLKCSYGDWGGKDYFSIDETQSCNEFALELLCEIQGFSEPRISLNTSDFHRLHAFYIECKLANVLSESEPFTEFGGRFSRVSRVASGEQKNVFKVMSGELPFEPQIPF